MMSIVLMAVLILLGSIANATNAVFNTLDNAVASVLDGLDKFLADTLSILKVKIVGIAKSVALILGLLGAFLWLSGIYRYGGRSMVFSAIILYLLSEVVKTL